MLRKQGFFIDFFIILNDMIFSEKPKKNKVQKEDIRCGRIYYPLILERSPEGKKMRMSGVRESGYASLLSF